MSKFEIKQITIDGQTIDTLLMTDDNGLVSSVPMNENNRHFQEYLEILNNK